MKRALREEEGKNLQEGLRGEPSEKALETIQTSGNITKNNSRDKQLTRKAHAGGNQKIRTKKRPRTTRENH